MNPTPGAGEGGAKGTFGGGSISLGLGNGSSSCRVFGVTGGTNEPPGIIVLDGGQGTGRPVTASKQPSIGLCMLFAPLPTRVQGGSAVDLDAMP